MPWKKVLPMEQKMAFIIKVKERALSFATICREFEVSRRTGYKWWRRYQESGMDGLRERSHRPHRCPHQSAPVWSDRVVALRLRHPSWGPKKLRVKLVARYGEADVPAVSTLGARLKASGLVRSRWRRRIQPKRQPGRLTLAAYPNQVWGVDFKGWFRTGDGRRCDPLTMSDLFSRYLVCCQVAADQSYAEARHWFEKVFKQYGLPEVIRVDNGGPFASTGAAGLSRLSVWWISLGIRPEFITPGHPEENGVHERMHRTLKAETTKPAAANGRAQQKRFERWRRKFNEERPHEALGQKTPASFYHFSLRGYGGEKARFIYPGDYVVRRVRSNGEIKWRAGLCYVGQAVIGQLVGLRQAEAGRVEVWFENYLLGDLYQNESGGLRPSVSVLQTSQQQQKLLPINQG
jgi:transposase InsO family protein